MIDLPDPKNLRASVSDGPMSWSEAMGLAASTTHDVGRFVENGNADYYALEKAYDERIAAIRKVSGRELPNPMRVASGVDRDMAAVVAAQAGGAGFMPLIGELSPDFRRRQEEEFNEKARALSGRYRQEVDQILSTSIGEDKSRVMRDAEAAARKASSSSELGPIGRFSAQLWGGLTGATNDPAQWGMAFIGAGGGTAKTVAGRIGQTMLGEGLLNGAQELLLQGMSQERKRAAGLEHGMGDMLANAGVAATFGALFGGSVQGAGELWRSLRARSTAGADASSFPDVSDEAGTAALVRVIDGVPEPGDVEIVAKVMGVDLSPDTIDMLGRSFEERYLDDVTIRDDASPDEIRVYEAAQRYAEDPDNNPPPEILEQMLAEQEAGRMRFSPDDYERMFSGDQNVVDDIADTFFADGTVSRVDAIAERVDRLVDTIHDQSIRPAQSVEPRDEAALRFAEEQAGEISEPRRVGPFGPIWRADEFSDWPSAVNALREADAGEIPGMLSHPEVGPIDLIWGSFDPGSPRKGVGLKKIAMKHPEVMSVLPDIIAGMNVVQRSENRIRLASADHRAVVRLDYDGQAKTWLFTAFETEEAIARRTGKTTNRPGRLQGDGQSSSPSSGETIVAPDGDDINLAEAMVDPARDRNGNPENYLDFIGVETGDGRFETMSAREALELASVPDLEADLLEACKL